GRVVGMTLKTAVVPAEFTAAGPTDATPGVLLTSDCIVDSSVLLAELDWLGSDTTTVSGPLVPTPNPSVIRSYACRLESDVGWVGPGGRGGGGYGQEGGRGAQEAQGARGGPGAGMVAPHPAPACERAVLVLLVRGRGGLRRLLPRGHALPACQEAGVKRPQTL